MARQSRLTPGTEHAFDVVLQHPDIAEHIISGRKTGAQMARLYGVS